MDEGSSVDPGKSDNSCDAVEVDGLNITSEIVTEAENGDLKEDLLNSTLEDSISRRAAKVLRITSAKELLTDFTEKQDHGEKKGGWWLCVWLQSVSSYFLQIAA